LNARDSTTSIPKPPVSARSVEPGAIFSPPSIIAGEQLAAQGDYRREGINRGVIGVTGSRWGDELFWRDDQIVAATALARARTRSARPKRAAAD